MKNIARIFKIITFCFVTVITVGSCKKDTPPLPKVITPTVTNVQPKDPIPGDIVTITGTGFGTSATDVKVTIGSQVITIATVTDTQIKFTLPAGITAGDIAIAIKSVVANNTDPQKATITPKPAPVPVATITAVNPASGKVGDAITITGTNFSTTATGNLVKFNGVAASVTASTATSITVSVPATATTGPITLSVNSAAVISGPSFTVNAATGGTGTAVPYFTTLAGTATFSKIATATAEIGAMVVDKVNNVLYFSDYTIFAPTHTGTIYKLKLDGSAPVALSTDPKIAKIVNMATDAAGNVYALASLDNLGGVQVNIYKIDASSSAITTIGTNVNYGASGYTLNADSQGGLWLGYGQKLNSATNVFDRNATFPYGSLSNATFQGDYIYVDDINHLPNNNIAFYKYNLLTKAASVTDFTLQGLFKQDNPAIGTSSGMDSQSKYALDNNENFYAIYPETGDAASGANDYYFIRKTKNGSAGSSTLISKFYTKPFSVASPVSYQQPRLNTGLLFQSDATGNLYLKANGKDIVKIVQ
ncbi:hypothetical protein BH09BAC6_BH09BAC6_13670 [soil metagenome]